jgi:hypothetical protein
MKRDRIYPQHQTYPPQYFPSLSSPSHDPDLVVATEIDFCIPFLVSFLDRHRYHPAASLSI